WAPMSENLISWYLRVGSRGPALGVTEVPMPQARVCVRCVRACPSQLAYRPSSGPGKAPRRGERRACDWPSRVVSLACPQFVRRSDHSWVEQLPCRPGAAFAIWRALFHARQIDEAHGCDCLQIIERPIVVAKLALIASKHLVAIALGPKPAMLNS